MSSFKAIEQNHAEIDSLLDAFKQLNVPDRRPMRKNPWPQSRGSLQSPVQERLNVVEGRIVTGAGNHVASGVDQQLGDVLADAPCLVLA